MGIFDKKTNDLPALLSDDELQAPAGYEQVLDFLVAINGADFNKVIKVANVYRSANKDVALVTGLEVDEPTSIFEKQTAPPVTMPDTDAGNFLDDDDELSAAFLDDEPAPRPSPKAKKVNVKSDKAD